MMIFLFTFEVMEQNLKVLKKDVEQILKVGFSWLASKIPHSSCNRCPFAYHQVIMIVLHWCCIGRICSGFGSQKIPSN